jgi:hypothetical protein
VKLDMMCNAWNGAMDTRKISRVGGIRLGELSGHHQHFNYIIISYCALNFIKISVVQDF